ncbi:Kef-type K+ transport system membrane component KefB [Streptomyces sp. BK208]|uniref:cation:proton antiporter n=1 Tax=Streptomyces sp. BK208 TaxID=2512150 RepID=UPI00105C894D|nr:cation:proton antiporter [Streptomyces sp. BK208]TDT31625.1 Kef-type K+ transport system membrane component KefB [Streptomyces sp. BK208]
MSWRDPLVSVAGAMTPAAGTSSFLIRAALLLAAARGLGRVASRLGTPAVTGELCAGVVLGPAVLGSVWPPAGRWIMGDAGDQASLAAVAQLGVVFLVGLAGLELRLTGIDVRTVSTVAACGLLLPLAGGFTLAFHLPVAWRGPQAGRSVEFALFVGVALAFTAVPVIAKTLTDLGLLRHRIGQFVLMVSAVDDAVGWLLLAALASLGREQASGPYAIAVTSGAMVAVSVGCWLAGRLAGRCLEARRGADAAAGMAVLFLVSAGASGLAGLEAVFGPFIAGVALGRRAPQLAEERGPLSAVVLRVLAPLFFSTVGLKVDFAGLAGWKPLTAAAAVLAVATVGKVVGGYAAARWTGSPPWEAFAVGIGINGRGVVTIVVASVGLSIGVFSSELYTVLVLVAVITSAVSGPLLRVSVDRHKRTAPHQETTGSPDNGQ